MMVCLGRNYSQIFKLTKYKIVVFDDVYILFHFNIILNTTGCPVLKLKTKPTWLICFGGVPLKKRVY